MNGVRVRGKKPHELAIGEYGRWADDHDNWYARAPSGSVANLTSHTVTEHEDGTITVAPSIEVRGYLQEHYWHGYIEHGVWRSC